MSILFGHPSGNPNSYNAALAHFNAGRLEAFCVPWMPSALALRVLGTFGVLRPMAKRLERRRFAPLVDAPKVQGRAGEIFRLAMRVAGQGDERLYCSANDWLMHTMKRECRRPTVSAVHSYEDCSLWQFEEAQRLGKACLYDLPIGYYPAWEQTQTQLARAYADWLPADGLPSSIYVRPEQKRREMELADLVLAPCSFVEQTIRNFHPYKKIARAAYGVDLDFWRPAAKNWGTRQLRFLYAGQLSLRKGIRRSLRRGRLQHCATPNCSLSAFGNWPSQAHRAAPRRQLVSSLLQCGAARAVSRSGCVCVPLVL